MANLEEAALQDIALPDVDAEAENVEISGCHYIGSYNWMNRDTPTIIVPGQSFISAQTLLSKLFRLSSYLVQSLATVQRTSRYRLSFH